MILELNEQELETIRTSLNYSKLNIQSSSDTPPSIRSEGIEKIDKVLETLRKAVGNGE